MAERIRLDLALEQRGLVQSRARARDAVLRGTVTVNGQPATKPGQLVGPADSLVISDPANAYVSRAALKLIAGLDAAAIAVTGRVALDIGASTGGFTQVLVERGATRVYAVDVGHGQLHPDVAALAPVISFEGTNAASLDATLVPEPVDLLACDASFVSVTKILAAPLALCRPGADAIILIKPQFEVGRESVGRGGIVTDEAAIADATARILAFMAERGWTHLATLPSPITGGDGNKELLAVFRRSG